jgi:hypothetical protein
MKNEFVKFMREHNIDVGDRVLLDIIPGYILSVIPEHNFYYRDENDYVHVAPRSEPYSIYLNTYVFFKDNEGKYEVIHGMYETITTADELNKYLKELPELISHVQDN